jgi:Uma2 family endonuclease
MTMAEYRALPEGPPYYEYEKGKLILMPSPTSIHQDVILELAHRVKHFAREHHLGQVFVSVDVYLPDEEHGYIPDLSFVSTAHSSIHSSDDLKLHGAPDLVVEVLSTDPERDRVEKFRVYYNNGVRWYWIVDPERLTIEEYHAAPEGYVRTASIMSGEEFKPGLFEGLVINLATLVAPPAVAPTPGETSQQPK